MIKIIILCSIVFILDFAYGAWFWRNNRTEIQWIGYIVINLCCVTA